MTAPPRAPVHALPERLVSTLSASAGDRLGPLAALGAALSRVGAERLFAAAREHGTLGSVYRPYTNLPAERVPLVTLHADSNALAEALHAGEFGTWDAALDLLSALADPETDALAAGVFAANYWVWPELGERAKAILTKSPSDAALGGLLAGLAAEVPGRVDLAAHPHPRLAAELHAALLACGATTFEPLDWPGVDAWDALSAADQRAFDLARAEASQHAPRASYVQAILIALGAVDPSAALDDRLAMATGHPVPALRQAALTSLLRSPDDVARQVLRAAVSDAKAFATGVYHVVRSEPERAFELLAPWFTPERLEGPCARQVARTAVAALLEDAERCARANPAEPGSTGSPPRLSALARDPRWVDIVAAHESTDDVDTRALLPHVDPRAVSAVRAALRSARRAAAARAGGGPKDRLARYVAGEHEAVWRELLDAGDLQDDAALHAEAVAVARETMQRVRDTIDTLAERLAAKGILHAGAVRSPPNAACLARLEGAFGPFPVSLSAFYDIVGSVSFAVADDAPESALVNQLRLGQPLVVVPVELVAEHLGDPAQTAREAPRFVWLAPDESGGPPDAVRIPSSAADAMVLRQGTHLPFVSHLRMALGWAGYPGLAGAARKPRRFLREVSEGLGPL